MKKQLSSNEWAMSADLLALGLEADEQNMDASAETFSCQTDPRVLLQALEEAWDDADEDIDFVF
jgi:hypothetical protein